MFTRSLRSFACSGGSGTFDDQLGEGDGEEAEVVAELLDGELLLVDDRGARARRRADVLGGRLGVHQDEDVELALAGDVARRGSRGS